MEVSRSGYYKYLQYKPNQKDRLNSKLLVEVKALAQESRHSYGSRRMAKYLQAKGYDIGRYAARTLMRQAGIECQQRRRYRITTQSQHDFGVAKNLLNQKFTVPAPNHAWVADITYLKTQEGWLYLAALLDLFSRRIVGWAMADHLRETLIHEALQMALCRRQPSQGLLHHSDQGVQYASDRYQSTLKAAGIRISMSRRGNCWDNSVMERFFGSLKSERTNHTVYKTREKAKADVIDYIEMFYNSKRLHSTLDYVTPIQFENQFLLKNMSTFT